MARTQYIDEPNLIVPLAASYNTRAHMGFTQAVTNATDQRKVNCVYEPVVNALSKKVTLYLVKRPGVTASAQNYGVSSQTAYLLGVNPGASGAPIGSMWVFSASGNDLRVSDDTSTSVLTSDSQNFFKYVDSTRISEVETLVVQIRSPTTIRTFHTSTFSGFTEITDPTYAGQSFRGKGEQLDGYMFQGTASRIYNSDLNSLASWSDDGYIARRSLLDEGTGLAKLGPQIISFGDATMEVFRNVGNAKGSPLESVQELAQRYGLADQHNSNSKRHYYAELSGRIYWISNNPTGVYTYDGARVEKVSSIAVDKIITERGHFFVCAISVHGKRAICIGLDNPTATTHRALMFYPEWNDWFEFSSAAFAPLAIARADSVFIGTATSSNKIFSTSQTADSWRDAGQDYTMTVQFKLPSNGNAHQQLRMFGVKGDTASSRTTSTLNVRFSTDDWQTSTAARTIDLTKAKKHIYRCGGYSDLGVYLDHTGNLDCRLEAAVARIE